MPRTKLTPADRTEIAQRFRETPATATSLAAEREVSISTIIRILKEELTGAVYDSLVPQKRAGRWLDQPTPTPSATTAPEIRSYKPVTDAFAPPPEPPAEWESVSNLTTSPASPPAAEASVSERRVSAKAVETKVSQASPALKVVETKISEPSPALEEPDAPALPEWDGDVQDDWEDDENEEEDSPGTDFTPASISQQILPLAASALPPTCYLVVDRFAELVARPLTEFSHWGELPTTSDTARTLPVFDNHRVAKRFSGRGHRILKVPDANLLYKTSGYLYDKGITHLLINGQVYTVGQAQT